MLNQTCIASLRLHHELRHAKPGLIIIVAVIPKAGMAGLVPVKPPFWYDNNKDLKKRSVLPWHSSPCTVSIPCKSPRAMYGSWCKAQVLGDIRGIADGIMLVIKH